MSGQIPPGSVVVAVDGSEHADRAVGWATEQCFLEHRPLVAVTVGDDRDAIADDAVALAKRLHPDVRVSTRLLSGDPREALIDLSSAARLLVLGSRGRGTLKSLLLGSVSIAVTRHAHCPVVVCRPRTAAGPGSGVVVGADGTPESMPVIEFAFQQASLRELRITVVHCFWDAVAAAAGFRKLGADLLTDPQFEELSLVLSESVAGFAEKYPEVPVSLRLTHGLVDETLSPRGSDSDLIVVGRHALASADRVLVGSISTAVLERAQTTVAIVPEDAPPVVLASN